MGRKKIIDAALRPLGFGAYRLGGPQVQEQAFQEAALRYKKAVVTNLAREAGYVVARGPFAGLRLPEMGAWSDYDLVAKIVGSYEAELFPALEEAVAAQPTIIFNIGASEGYYAIGLKRLLPAALVYTFDIDANSYAALDSCARMNSVAVTRLDNFSFSNPLDGIDAEEGASFLFFADCEGAENNIVKFPHSITCRTTFVIELHDLFVPGTTERLTQHLAQTHDIRIINQKERNISDYPEVAGIHGPVRHILLDEFRAESMRWLFAVPKLIDPS